MRKLFASAILMLVSFAVVAQESPLVGTWKLKTVVHEVTATGERKNQFGDSPLGYISYAPDGRMYAMGVRSDRSKPAAAAPTPEEATKLFQSMFAYTGSYTLEPGKVTHHIDVSWNQGWTGTDQVRFYKLDGNMLTIKSAPAKSPLDGREGQFVLEFEKVPASKK
jgi:hypothetical protein